MLTDESTESIYTKPIKRAGGDQVQQSNILNKKKEAVFEGYANVNIDMSKALDNDEIKEDPDEFVKALIADNSKIGQDLTPKLGGKLSLKSSSKKELKTSKSVNESNIKNNLRDSNILTPL